jgi:L,D-peptidoglycan transpeptidase YkuD (ErfK/YbiS/YcfS/YnhG family)
MDISMAEHAVYNAGSAIFFHISYTPTAGCIGTDRDSVLKYLSKLQSSSNPYILIV